MVGLNQAGSFDLPSYLSTLSSKLKRAGVCRVSLASLILLVFKGESNLFDEKGPVV